MRQVMGSKLKRVRVHLGQLVHAVQEEYEKWGILFAIVHVWPTFHFFLSLANVLVLHMLPVVYLLHDFGVLHKQRISFQKVMLEVYPVFVKQCFEAFEAAVVRV
jgi:hypothetical protein